MELERLIPLASERQSPVLIEVPFGEMSIPPAPQFAPLYKLPWTMPQEGLIQSKHAAAGQGLRAGRPVLPAQGPDTSAPDIGDSEVLELVGLGGTAVLPRGWPASSETGWPTLRRSLQP